MPECYIRGSTIKYLRIPDEVIDMVKEDSMGKGRGRGGSGRGRGKGKKLFYLVNFFCNLKTIPVFCPSGAFGGRGRGAPGGNKGQPKKPGRGRPRE